MKFWEKITAVLTTVAFVFVAGYEIFVHNKSVILGAIYPVTQELIIQDVQPYRDGASLVTGFSSKIRDECTYVGIEWFLGDRDEGSDHRVKAYYESTNHVSLEDYFKHSKLVVGLQPFDVRYHSHADILHTCNGHITRTIYYR